MEVASQTAYTIVSGVLTGFDSGEIVGGRTKIGTMWLWLAEWKSLVDI